LGLIFCLGILALVTSGSTLPGQEQVVQASVEKESESKMMPVTLESIGAWCNGKNMRFVREDESNRVTIPDVGRYKLKVIVIVDPKTHMLLWLIPVVTGPKADTEVLARAANRANEGISMGAFVARKDGVVLLRMASSTREMLINKQGIEYQFDLALGSVNALYEAWQKVNEGTVKPEDIFTAMKNP